MHYYKLLCYRHSYTDEKCTFVLRRSVVIPCSIYYLKNSKSKMNNILEVKIQFTGNGKRREATESKFYQTT